MSHTILRPEDWEALAPNTVVVDAGGLYAVKADSGAWQYQTGEFWEPEFPVRVVAFIDREYDEKED